MDPKSQNLGPSGQSCFESFFCTGLRGCAGEFPSPEVGQTGLKVGPAGLKANPTCAKGGPNDPKGGPSGAKVAQSEQFGSSAKAK